MQKWIKELEGKESELQNTIKYYSHPEEQLEEAKKDFAEALNNYLNREHEMTYEFEEAQAKLKKPWYEYAKAKRDRWSRSHKYAHPIAQRCSELNSRLASNHNWMEHARQRMNERQEVLDNFWALMDEAEKKLAQVREELRQWRTIEARKAAKKRPQKAKEPVNHNVRHSFNGEEWELNTDDLKGVANNGAEGVCVWFEYVKESIFLPKPTLRDCIKSIGEPFKVFAGATDPKHKHLTFKWSTGHLAFFSSRAQDLRRGGPAAVIGALERHGIAEGQGVVVKLSTQEVAQ